MDKKMWCSLPRLLSSTGKARTLNPCLFSAAVLCCLWISLESSVSISQGLRCCGWKETGSPKSLGDPGIWWRLSLRFLSSPLGNFWVVIIARGWGDAWGGHDFIALWNWNKQFCSIFRARCRTEKDTIIPTLNLEGLACFQEVCSRITCSS